MIANQCEASYLIVHKHRRAKTRQFVSQSTFRLMITWIKRKNKIAEQAHRWEKREIQAGWWADRAACLYDLDPAVDRGESETWLQTSHIPACWFHFPQSAQSGKRQKCDVLHRYAAQAWLNIWYSLLLYAVLIPVLLNVPAISCFFYLWDKKSEYTCFTLPNVQPILHCLYENEA